MMFSKPEYKTQQAIYYWLRAFSSASLGVILLYGFFSLLTATYSEYVTRKFEYSKWSQLEVSHNERITNKILENCSISEGPVRLPRDCLKEQIQAAISNSASNKDLVAQQDMAYWAMMTFAVGVVSALISICALVGLFLSLRQTRQAISNDREIGNAQVRAYIAIEIGDTARRSIESQTFKIINTGQSPAIDVKHVAGILILTHPHSGYNDIIRAIENENSPQSTIPAGQDLSADAPLQDALTTENMRIINKNGDKRLYVVIRVFYKDVFGVRHETKLCAFSDVSKSKLNGEDIFKVQWVLADRLNEMT